MCKKSDGDYGLRLTITGRLGLGLRSGLLLGFRLGLVLELG